MSKYVIETKNLTKKYGTQKNVADLNIHVQKGRIYGLLGSLIESSGFYPNLTATENLRIFAALLIAFVYGYGGVIAALLITVVFVFSVEGNTPVKTVNNHKKAITKKGW